MKYCWLILLSVVASAQTVRNLHENWQFRRSGTTEFLKATVPGTVHTDLMQNHIIQNPHFGTVEKDVQWIENEDWEYYTTFLVSSGELASENIELVFEGLDTYASISLNGVNVGTTDNMFRCWEFEVKNLLKKGKNELKIVFASSVNHGKSEASKLPYKLPENERVFSRKAQYQYGWDWGPRLVTAGVWKPVSLKFWNRLKIESVSHEILSLIDKQASLVFTINVKCLKPGAYRIKVNDVSKDVTINVGKNKIHIPFEIKNPKRWWTNGLGEAHLYPFEIGLFDGKKKVSETKINIGLRTVELVRNQDEKGETFYFKLNGKPVFMKGANIIPPDNFLPRKTKSDYEKLVADAKDANMNMLRVWGGGVYADDDFMNACDRGGILVWQDFMFACAMYPHDATFLETVKQEIIDQAGRLQNHASLALWCGNNESDEAWKNWGWQKQFNYSEADSTQIWNGYKKLFHELIPKTLDSLLPKNKNIYWPSSPSIGWGRKESLTRGDSHYWGVWWGKQPFEIYEEKIPRFMSEYGFQSVPAIETLQKWLPAGAMSLTSEAMKSHQKHPTGFETIDEYLARNYVVPKEVEDYIYVSQLLQARGMKTAIEAHRRAMPYCMGTLYWQLNDCWPVTSWSSVDSEGRWKAFHYQAKRSFENALISVEKKEGKHLVFFINDNLKSQSGKLKLSILKFDGSPIWKDEKHIEVQPQQSTIVYEIPDVKFDRFQSVLSLRFEGSDSIESTYFFAKPKDLKLTKPTISINKIDAKTYEISADVLAKDVMIESGEAKPSDNFFDLLPGKKKMVKFNLPVNEIGLKTLNDIQK